VLIIGIHFIQERNMINKIVEEIPEDKLQTDLEKFRQLAIELGAADAKIITTDKVIVDERVRAKCMNPKCSYYGTNGNCPPHAPDLDTVRKIVHNFHYGIFVISKHPRETISAKSPHSLDNHKIVAKIESRAFHSGYYLALGLADGPCKSRYCPDKECSVLTGNGCRMGLRARYSMESWGMDVYRMATRAGWDIYPIGAATRAEDVPYQSALGLIFIY
jgi:predicted metal-binding protein